MRLSWLENRSVRGVAKVGIDAVTAATAVLLSIALAGPASFGSLRSASILALIVAAATVSGIAIASGYRAIWHFSSVFDALRIVAVNLGLGAILYLIRVIGVAILPPATVVLIPLLNVAFAVGMRAARRWYVEDQKRRTRNRVPAVRHREPYRVIIAGAGLSGALLSRDLLLTAPEGVDLIGFLDDDPKKLGGSVNGIPVLANLSSLGEVADQYRVDELLVAVPSAPREVVRSLIRQAEDVGIRVRAVPGVERLLLGTDLHRPGSVTLHELFNGSLAGHERGKAPDPKSVLVTGGAGFIGSHLVRLLLDRGYAVRVLDTFAYGAQGLASIREHPRLEVVPGDISDMKAVTKAVRDVSGVIALAAIVGDPACNLDPEETVNLNYQSTKILMEACTFYGVRRLVFASSCSVYGASSDTLLTERSRLHPISLYARTRILSENILFDRHGEVEPVVLRLGTVFGWSPRMRFDLVVNTLTARAVMDRRITIFGGNQWRPHVHCRDAARAFVLSLEAPAAAVAGEVFNVGGNELNMRIRDLGDLVAGIVGDVEVSVGQNADDQRDYRVCFDKARRVLGFTPDYTLERGIREVADALENNRALQSYEDSLYHNVRALRARMSSSPTRDRVIQEAVG